MSGMGSERYSEGPVQYSLDELLASHRAATLTEREKGAYLEWLSAAFLLSDPVQAEQYEAVSLRLTG